jgi:hypothetical protein
MSQQARKSRSNRNCNVQIFVLLSLLVGCSQLPLDIDVEGDAGTPPGMAGQGQGGSPISSTGGQGGLPQGGQAGVAVVDGGAGGVVTTGGMGGMGGVVATGGTGTGGMGAGGSMVTMGGSGGSPPVLCTENDVRCSSVSANVVESCVLGTWTFQKDCGSNGCNMGKCNVCKPNEVFCSVSQRTKSSCSADGQKETLLACQYGCIADGTDCRECLTDNVLECPSATSVHTCTAGRWSPITSCPATQVCSTKGCGCPVGKGWFDSKCVDLMGYSTQFNYVASPTAGFLGAHKITVTRTGTLRGLGVIAKSSGARIRLALYKDSGGVPSSLLAESPASDLATGSNHLKTNVSPVLAVGDYWISFTLEASASIFQEAVGNKVIVYQVAQGFSSALPTTWTGTSMFMAYPFNLFALVE